MRRFPILLATAATALACAGLGGASVPIGPHLAQVCAALDEAPLPPLDLVRLDRSPAPLPDAPLVEVRADGTARVDGAHADDLGAAVAGVAARRAATGDEPPSTSVILAIEADVPVERAIEAYQAVHEAGLTWAVLAAWSDVPVALPPPPDPAYAKELQAALPSAPDLRAVQLAERMEDEVRWCPGAQEVFEALAMAEPDRKCAEMADGLARTLPRCPLTGADRVLTLVQLGFAPPPLRPTHLGVALEPEAAAPLRVAPGTRWAEVLPALAATEPPPGWLATER